MQNFVQILVNKNFSGKLCLKIGWKSWVGKLCQRKGWTSLLKIVGKMWFARLGWTIRWTNLAKKVVLKNCMEQYNWQLYGKHGWPVWVTGLIWKFFLEQIGLTNLVEKWVDNLMTKLSKQFSWTFMPKMWWKI